uniref:Putative ovule protein n=1 Tax=Solanum chacoense TaxID=4108 RepID=A0A0V0HHQ7_SOLCH
MLGLVDHHQLPAQSGTPSPSTHCSSTGMKIWYPVSSSGSSSLDAMPCGAPLGTLTQLGNPASSTESLSISPSTMMISSASLTSSSPYSTLSAPFSCQNLFPRVLYLQPMSIPFRL